MKASSINELKKELELHNNSDILSYCIRLAKYKKENKELLSFLLFNAGNISFYVDDVKQETDEYFQEINSSNIYYIKKSVRKILRNLNKHIKFIASAQAEAELRIYFCNCVIDAAIPLNKSVQLINLYNGQIKKIDEALSGLHPDLQHDYKKLLKKNKYHNFYFNIKW